MQNKSKKVWLTSVIIVITMALLAASFPVYATETEVNPLIREAETDFNNNKETPSVLPFSLSSSDVFPTHDIAINTDMIYNIKCALSNKYIGVGDSVTKYKTNVFLYQFDGSYAQEWKFINVGTDLYQIMNLNNKKYLAVESRDTDGICVWTDTLDSAQTFKAIKNRNGSFSFLIECSNYTKTLAIRDLNQFIEEQRDQTAGSAVENQQFFLEHAANRLFAIHDSNGNLYMDPAVELAKNRGKIEEELGIVPGIMVWALVKVNDKDYNIININSGKFVTVSTSLLSGGSEIQLEEHNGSDGQLFGI